MKELVCTMCKGSGIMPGHFNIEQYIEEAQPAAAKEVPVVVTQNSAQTMCTADAMQRAKAGETSGEWDARAAVEKLDRYGFDYHAEFGLQPTGNFVKRSDVLEVLTNVAAGRAASGGQRDPVLAGKMRQFAEECLRRIKLNPRTDGDELHTRGTYEDILKLCGMAAPAAAPDLSEEQVRQACVDVGMCPRWQAPNLDWSLLTQRLNALLRASQAGSKAASKERT